MNIVWDFFTETNRQFFTGVGIYKIYNLFLTLYFIIKVFRKIYCASKCGHFLQCLYYIFYMLY